MKIAQNVFTPTQAVPTKPFESFTLPKGPISPAIGFSCAEWETRTDDDGNTFSECVDWEPNP